MEFILPPPESNNLAKGSKDISAQNGQEPSTHLQESEEEEEGQEEFKTTQKEVADETDCAERKCTDSDRPKGIWYCVCLGQRVGSSRVIFLTQICFLIGLVRLCFLQLGLQKLIAKRRPLTSWYLPFVWLTFYRPFHQLRMNKLVSTRERVQMFISGASCSGKTILLLMHADWTKQPRWNFPAQLLKNFVLLPNCDFWQPIYNKFFLSLGNKINFAKCDSVDFEESIKDAIQNSLSQLSTSFSNKEVEQKMLLVIFDDSCEEMLQSRFFVTCAQLAAIKISISFS